MLLNGQHAPSAKRLLGLSSYRALIPGQYCFLGPKPVLNVVAIFHPALDIQLKSSSADRFGVCAELGDGRCRLLLFKFLNHRWLLI